MNGINDYYDLKWINFTVEHLPNLSSDKERRKLLIFETEQIYESSK